MFIGQGGGSDKDGGGMKQAEQKKVLNEFRAGDFNTLVATCIGEEGLDIPQVRAVHAVLCMLRCRCTHGVMLVQPATAK